VTGVTFHARRPGSSATLRTKTPRIRRAIRDLVLTQRPGRNCGAHTPPRCAVYGTREKGALGRCPARTRNVDAHWSCRRGKTTAAGSLGDYHHLKRRSHRTRRRTPAEGPRGIDRSSLKLCDWSAAATTSAIRTSRVAGGPGRREAAHNLRSRASNLRTGAEAFGRPSPARHGIRRRRDAWTVTVPMMMKPQQARAVS
jgi:hypothetical protein